MKKTRKIFTLSILGLTLGTAIPVLANSGKTIKSYNIILPRIGNSTTGNIIKVNKSAGINNNQSIGGGKTLNTSIKRASNGSDITPSLKIGSGSRVAFNYNGGNSNYVGANTKLSMASGLLNVVRIQTQGSWSPDDK